VLRLHRVAALRLESDHDRFDDVLFIASMVAAL
jgi:hypothetical protein